MTLIGICSLAIGEKKIFHELEVTSCLERRNQTFLGSGGRNESNMASACQESVRRKFFINSKYIISRKEE